MIKEGLDWPVAHCRKLQRDESRRGRSRWKIARYELRSNGTGLHPTRNDFAAEHEIYREDAVLHYPQSGERIRGRRRIQESRTVQPSQKRFAVQRIIGDGDLWVTEFVLSYDGTPSYTVSIMEFSDGKVARETQYFCDPFKPGPSRAHLVELD